MSTESRLYLLKAEEFFLHCGASLLTCHCRIVTLYGKRYAQVKELVQWFINRPGEGARERCGRVLPSRDNGQCPEIFCFS